MCSHHARHRWARTWDAWLTVVAVSFFGMEGVALYTRGEGATLTAHIRRVAGLQPRCRHAHLGRLVLVGVFGWCISHLAFGMLPAEGWLDRVATEGP